MTKRKLLEITVSGYTEPTSTLDTSLAACRGLTDTMTMPLRVDGDSDEIEFDKYKIASDAAKEVCRPCPIITPCREYGLQLSRVQEDYGVYGGLDPLDRQKIVMVRVTFDPDLEVPSRSSCGPKAGTHAGIKAHERAEPPSPKCEQCLDFAALKARRSREKKKAAKAADAKS